MLFQYDNITPLTDMTPIIEIIMFIFIIVLTIYCYGKFKYFELMLLIYAISLIISLISIGQNVLIFTPWFQIFFMFFQTIIMYRVWLNKSDELD